MFLLENTRRAVLKLGTGLLTSGKAELDTARLHRIGEQVAALREKGIEVVIVSSGAIGLGMGQLRLTERPADLPTLQACAAIGQAILMDLWRRAFAPCGSMVAQILLTHEDVRSRQRHLAVRATFERLISLGVIPVVNENDTVSADEIKFGDNDKLSALVASLVDADLLVILSTVAGLLDYDQGGRLIPFVEQITPEIEALAGGTTNPKAVGGMRSKISAARIATQSGCGVFIGSGDDPALLLHLFAGRAVGTFFAPHRLPLHSRKRWLAFFQQPRGTVRIDAGAAEALAKRGSSLLARGLTTVEGFFQSGEIVNIADPEGRVLARGVCQYSSAEAGQISGKTSDEIRTLFPDRHHTEVVHRDSLVLL